jgi:hypothetical protein
MCRARFTALDMAFIVSTLCQGRREEESLLDLLSEPGTLTTILDHPRLLQAILDNLGCLHISVRLYFYVLVRHVFKEASMDDPDLADYVAEMLSVFASAHRARSPLPDQSSPMEYVVDMMAALQTANRRERFLIRAHLGNYSLFLVGMFPQFIRHRRNRRAAPDVAYYEQIGQTNYRIAGGHVLAEKLDLHGIFSTLSDQFHSTRLALNDLAERLIWVHDQGADVRGWLDGGTA